MRYNKILWLSSPASTAEALIPDLSERNSFSSPSGVGNRGETEKAAGSHNRIGTQIGPQIGSRTVPEAPSEQHTMHQTGQRYQHKQQRLQAVRPVPLDDDHPASRNVNAPYTGVRTPITESFRDGSPPQRVKARASTGEGRGDPLKITPLGSSTLRKGLMERMVVETLGRRRHGSGDLHEGVAPIEKASEHINTDGQGVVREEKKESLTVSPVTRKEKDEERLQDLDRERQCARVLALEDVAGEELRRRRRELMEERQKREKQQRETDVRRLPDDTNAAAAVTIKTLEQGHSIGDGAAIAPAISSSVLEGGAIGDEEGHRRAPSDDRRTSTSDVFEGPIKQEHVEDGPIRKDDLTSLVPQAFREDGDRAREEAWAEARVLSERRAQARALLEAQSRRAGASDGQDEKAPPASVVESDSETEKSRRGSVTLDQSESVQSTMMPTRGGRGWTGLFSDRRREDKRTAPFSASSSVTSSQVRTKHLAFRLLGANHVDSCFTRVYV